MSEVKGTLLAIILAISVFSIVFTVVTVAIKNNADTIKDRMSDAVTTEPSPELLGEDTLTYVIR